MTLNQEVLITVGIMDILIAITGAWVGYKYGHRIGWLKGYNEHAEDMDNMMEYNDKYQNLDDIESDNKQYGQQSWELEEEFAANYAEENKQQLYDYAGVYWNQLTVNERIDQLKEWDIPQAFIPINIPWKSVPEDVQIPWVTHYTEQDEYKRDWQQKDEEFWEEIAHIGNHKQDKVDQVYGRSISESQAAHYIDQKGGLS